MSCHAFTITVVATAFPYLNKLYNKILTLLLLIALGSEQDLSPSTSQPIPLQKEGDLSGIYEAQETDAFRT